ncbi:MAG TPA: hypothetical protein VJZ75_04530 [Candidatus Bathyarchaeia archaeon]|nr:hypothetical protein [Candidatus Bathyarchaeia archaeon]
MIPVNYERNRQVYLLWEQGYSVEEIASVTAIPRSTVGYYVRKFNLYAKDGRPIVLPQSRARHQENVNSAMGKGYVISKVMERVGKDPEYVDRFLSVLEHLKNLGMIPTQEEMKALEKELAKSSPLHAAKPQASQQDTGLTMNEVIDRVKSKAAYRKK